MRSTKLPGDPDHCFGFEPSQIGHDLARMRVIGGFHLVLDQCKAVIHRGPGQDIRAEAFDRNLGPGQLKGNADHL